MTAFYVAIGGALGSLARYGISRLSLWLLSALAKTANWTGTLAVNVLGSFLIAFLTMWIRETHPAIGSLSPLLIVGFCGGFTTFSTFALDGYKLWNGGAPGVAFTYILLSLTLSIGALFLGFWAGAQAVK